MSGYIENWGYGQGDGGGSGNLPTFPDAGATNALAIQTASYVLLIGDIFTITNVVANNTGPTTISINSATPVAIVGLNNTPMQGHELVAGLDAVFFLNSVGTVTLISAMSGSLQIADGVQNHHAVTIGQLITQLGLYLKTSNNLSEIATAGTAAQSTARTNIGAQVSGTSLQTANLLSEIAALGSTAQATAQSNLGISGGGSGGSGRLLGVALITTSQTYTMPSGTNTIIAEIVGGGSASVGTPANTTGVQYAMCGEGKPGTYMMVQIPVSQLSTHAAGTVIISIGAAGAPGTASNSGAGGATTIDTSVAIANGGSGESYALNQNAIQVTSPTTTNSLIIASLTEYTGTVTSPTVILKLLDSRTWTNRTRQYGILAGTVLLRGPVGLASYAPGQGFTFFESNTITAYGCGGSFLQNAGVQPATTAPAGTSGAVRLWMYS